MFRPIAAIITAELLATARPVTGWFQAFEAGNIGQWLSGRIATGPGVGAGVGLVVGAGVMRAAGGAVGVALAPGLADGPGEPGAGDGSNELPGAIEAKVPGARPEAIARADGGVEAGPTADGAQAAIRATTRVAPTRAEGRVRFTL